MNSTCIRSLSLSLKFHSPVLLIERERELAQNFETDVCIRERRKRNRRLGVVKAADVDCVSQLCLLDFDLIADRASSTHGHRLRQQWQLLHDLLRQDETGHKVARVDVRSYSKFSNCDFDHRNAIFDFKTQNV